VAGTETETWVVDLARGTGHIVGMVSADGAPVVTRAWGVAVLDGGLRARLLLGAVEVGALGAPAGDPVGTDLALTSTDIRTFRSVQVKGPIESVEAVDADDIGVAATYRSAFFADCHDMDQLPYELLERIVPDELVAFTFRIREAFDQTPGEGAGRPLPMPGGRP
jgi:hypothetical protein